MNKKIKNFLIFIVFFLVLGCSFDKRSGIWSGSEEERERLSRLKKDLENREIYNVYSSQNEYSEEIAATKKVELIKANKNMLWEMPNFNLQNNLGNFYLSGVEDNFLKKKVGKNKFSISKVMAPPLLTEEYVIFSDDVGTIFNMTKQGKVKWKKNIYKKIYKKIYKNLSLYIHESKVFAVDNIGFIYSLNLETGEIIWIKNLKIPIKSHIKIHSDKIFVVNQENRILCLDIKNGKKIWDIRTVTSFIKLQNYLGLAVSEQGDLIVLSSSGDLFRLKTKNGLIYWSVNATGSLFAHDTDFFKSSEIALNGEDIIFSASNSTFSYDLASGYVNWRKDIPSVGTPIVNGENVFLVTQNGYFVNLDRKTGEIIWSTNTFKNLKKKKRLTNVTGYVMGSEKIYISTLNGNLIICSASSGEVQSIKKIGDTITAPPVISDGSIFLLTEDSRILGFR
tara:strand:- start:15844 stop:17193 length:1350 start_codon:yes stop_codon:yes gene_type:complete